MKLAARTWPISSRRRSAPVVIAGAHVGLGLPGRQPLAEWETRQHGRQLVAQVLELPGKKAVVKDETEVVFDHTQPFAGAVAGGVDDAEGGKGGWRAAGDGWRAAGGAVRG